MNETPKWILKSRTVWGVILTVLGLFLDASVLTDVATAGDSILGLLPEITEVVGILLTLYGRITAKAKVTMLPGK